MKNRHRVVAQAVESRDVLLDLLPVRRVPDVVGDVTDAIKTNKEMNPFELLPERNQFFGKNSAVGVVARPDMAASPVSQHVFTNSNCSLIRNGSPPARTTSFICGRSVFKFDQNSSLRYHSKRSLSIRRGEMPYFQFALLRDLTHPLRQLHPAARFLRPAHKALHIARIAEPQIDILEGSIRGSRPPPSCRSALVSFFAASLFPAFVFCEPE